MTTENLKSFLKEYKLLIEKCDDIRIAGRALNEYVKSKNEIINILISKEK
jgi:hypothetical protein